MLRAGQVQGEIRENVSLEDISAMITGMYFTGIFDWIHDGGAWSLEEKLMGYLELLYQGIRP